jgi:hypothetical protein
MITKKELETIWNKAIVHNLLYYPGLCMEGQKKVRKILVRIADITVWVRNRLLLNISQKLYVESKRVP